MRSFNDWYFDLFESGNGARLNQQEIAEEAWDYRQTEVDELRAKFDQHDQWLGQRNRDVQELYDINVKHAAEKAELQKRVDAVKGLIEDLNKCYQQDHQNKFEYWRGFSHSAGISAKRLEQALKGGGE